MYSVRRSKRLNCVGCAYAPPPLNTLDSRIAHGNVPCPAFMALEGHLARTTNSLLSGGSGQASFISGSLDLLDIETLEHVPMGMELLFLTVLLARHSRGKRASLTDSSRHPPIAGWSPSVEETS